MKTIFKSIFAAAVMTAFSSAAFAQLGANTNITATARILKQITLASSNVNFGTIPAGTAPDLSPTGVGSTNTGFTAVAGRLLIDATPDEQIRVEFPDSIKLGLNTDSVTYIPEVTAVYGDVALGDAGQATSIPVNNIPASPIAATAAGGNGRGPFAIVYTDPTIGSNKDKVSLFIGGQLYEEDNSPAVIPTTQATGTYTGTMLFNVLYAN